MAGDTLKSLPRGIPPAALTRAQAGSLPIAEPKEDRAGLRLSIDGGMASERFDLEIEATGDGELTCDLACSLSNRRVDEAAVRVEPERLARIASTVDVPRLARMSLRQGGFPAAA